MDEVYYFDLVGYKYIDVYEQLEILYEIGWTFEFSILGLETSSITTLQKTLLVEECMRIKKEGLGEVGQKVLERLNKINSGRETTPRSIRISQLEYEAVESFFKEALVLSYYNVDVFMELIKELDEGKFHLVNFLREQLSERLLYMELGEEGH